MYSAQDLQCETRTAPACFECPISRIASQNSRALIAREGGRLVFEVLRDVDVQRGTRITGAELVGVYLKSESEADMFLEGAVLDAAQFAIANPRCMHG